MGTKTGVFQATRCGGLGLAELGPFRWRLDPWAGEFADDDGELGRLQITANIVDEVHQVLLILGHGSLGVHAIVPALIPDEASEFVIADGWREFRALDRAMSW